MGSGTRIKLRAPSPRSSRTNITEAGRTCPRCAELCGWDRVRCPACNYLIVLSQREMRRGAA